jgi:hypothetical protein
MQRNGPPLFLLVAALLAVSPSAHDIVQHSADGKASTDKVEKAGSNDPAPGEETDDPTRRATSAKELARLYEGFFGKSASTPSSIPRPKASETRKVTITSPENQRSTWKVELDAPEELADPKSVLNEGRKRTACSTEFMIALVPDPLDSSLAISFDQAVSAIQMAFVDAGYLPDRFWLPWSGDAAKNKEYRANPGILLYRKEKDPCVLSTVFLVGETPKIGIQKEAFRQAIGLVDGLTERPEESLRILGPSFSGSIESLGFFFRSDLACQYQEHTCRANIVTGSATSSALDALAKLRCINVQRTVIQEPDFTNQALEFLQDKMGWDLNKLTLLTEGDTTYGQNLGMPRNDSNDDNLKKVNWAHFPSGLSGIREAWEEKGEPGDNQNAGNSRLGLPKLTLDLSLAERSEPVDTPPEFSPLTTRNKDLAIANLLTRVHRERPRYIGILATDPRDVIFLARRIKTFTPDTILFTIDNNLLYTHPTYGEFTDEMLVLSKYPLSIEPNIWNNFLEEPQKAVYMHQFMTELQQGIFEAAKSLIDVNSTKADQNRIWISAIGNGELWPIASLTEQGSKRHDNGIGVAEPPKGRKLLQLLYMGIVIAGFGCYLGYLLRQLVPALGHLQKLPIRGLLAIGMTTLWTMGMVLLAIATLFIQEYEAQSAILELTYLVCSLLLWLGICKTNLTKVPSLLWKWWLLGALLTMTLPWVVRWLWMPGGAAFFQMRVNSFSSGLSPLVSLFSACSAALVWVLLEIKRRGLQIQQGFNWPLQDWHSLPIFGCNEVADPLKELLENSLLPKRFWRFWLLLSLLLVPSGIYLTFVVQPVAETRWYGIIFTGLIAVGFVLATISFFRFIRLWRILRMILQRIDETEIPNKIKDISLKIAWKPMKSFAWPLPAFKMATLSAEYLETVLSRPRFRGIGNAADVKDKLAKVFAAHNEHSFEGESRDRQALNELFAENCELLKNYAYDPGVASFLAVRLVAWLRHMFAHMRSCLIGAMTSSGLLLLAIRTYAFEPKQFVFMSFWVLLLAAVVLTFWVFFEMDRNATLSAINGTNPGEISFDRTFFVNLLTYGATPLLGLAATQFPQIGRYFVGWLNPLLRVVGGN